MEQDTPWTMSEYIEAVTLGIKYGSKLVEYIKAVYHAHDDINELAERIEKSISFLKESQIHYETLPAEQREATLENLSLENLQGYKSLYEKLLAFLENKHSRLATLTRIEKLASKSVASKWPWKKKKFLAELDKLQQFEEGPLAKWRSLRIDKGISSIQGQISSESFNELMDRFSPSVDLNRLRKFRDVNNKKCVHSPPTWVCATDVFQRWLLREETSCSLLLGFGEGGCGKSCISSFLAKRLQHQPEPTSKTQDDQLNNNVSNIGVAVFYCTYTSGNVDAILNCLSRQLLEQLSKMKREVAQERAAEYLKETTFSGYSEGAFDSMELDSEALLAALSSDFERTFIIIDALDEILDDYEQLLRSLMALKSRSLRIFLTSRDSYISLGQSLLRLDVTKNDGVLHDYVAKKLEQIAMGIELVDSTILPDYLRDQTKYKQAVQQITNAAGNNFLCAELHINALKYPNNEDALEKTLSDLRGTVDKLVGDAMKRVIHWRDEKRKDIGLQALMWVICCKEVLTISQLQHAIALTMYPKEQLHMHQRQMVSFSDRLLKESTAHLLNIDGSTNLVRVHKAIYDYYNSADVRLEYFPNAMIETADACLRCLDPVYLDNDVTTLSTWTKEYTRSPFLDYAAQNLGWHVFNATKKTNDTIYGEQVSLQSQRLEIGVLRFVERSDVLKALNFDLLVRTKALNMIDPQSRHQLEVHGQAIFSSIHMLSHWQLHSLIRQWVQAGGNVDLLSTRQSMSKCGFTSLWLACNAADEDTALVLLKEKANPTLENGQKLFALKVAVRRGLSRVVRSILQSPDDIVQTSIEQCVKFRKSLITLAIISEHRSSLVIFQMLFEKINQMSEGEKLLNQRDVDNYTAMHIAAMHNCGSVIRILLSTENGKRQLEMPGNQNRDETPLHIAARHACSDALKILLESGADTAAKNANGRTPLSLMVQAELTKVSRESLELLVPKSDVSIVDNRGMNVVHVVCAMGRHLILEALLQLIPKRVIEELLISEDHNGLTPLGCAATTRADNWKQCFNMCLEHMRFIISRQDVLLAHRVMRQFDSLEIKLPADLFDDINSLSSVLETSGQSALHEFVEVGSIKHFEDEWHKIKESQPEMLQTRNSAGENVLIAAAKRQRLNIARFLVEHNADLNAQDACGKTALHHCVEGDAPDIAKLLVAAGARSDLEDDSKLTSIDRCSRNNRCLDLLMPDSGRHGRTPQQQTERECLATFSANPGWVLTAGHQVTFDQLEHSREHGGFGGDAFGGDAVEWLPSDVPVKLKDYDYLLSDPIPPATKLPITRVHVLVEGRDQGHSSEKWFGDRPEGSFTSETFYDLGIVRNGRTIVQRGWARNRHRVKETFVFECSWHVDGGLNDASIYGRENVTGEHGELDQFVRALRLGDRIVVIVRARGLDWINIIKRAEIRVYEG